MMEGTVVGAFDDGRVEPLPVLARDWLVPVIQVSKDNSDRPGRTGVSHVTQKGQCFLDARPRFLPRWPLRILRQSRSGRTACGIEIADDHVIKKNVVKSPRAQPPTDQVRMNVEHGDF